jgi:hypothetical protein
LTVSVEKSKHIKMETQNDNAAAATKEEEESTIRECPYKRMKMDGESDSPIGEALVSVTSLENPKDLSSNGGDDGEKLQVDTSDDFVEEGGEEGEPDGDSENGEFTGD